MQTVLSQRISVRMPKSFIPLSCITSLNPSPYMYFLNLDDTHIVGSSPEILRAWRMAMCQCAQLQALDHVGKHKKKMWHLKTN